MATPDYTIDESKQTVQGQLNTILDQNNPLMQKAKATGQQYANNRGLLNSSIGGAATQSAMMDYAMPIASQDAATHNAFASQKYGASLTKDMNQQAQDFAQANMNLQDTLTQGQMNLGANLDIAKMQKGSELAQADARFNTDLAKEQATHVNELDIEKLALSTAANLQGVYVDAIGSITQDAAVSINEIETAEGIEVADKDKMIQNTIDRRDADLAFTKNLFSNMPTWDFSWVDITDGTMPVAPGVTLPEAEGA